MKPLIFACHIPVYHLRAFIGLSHTVTAVAEAAQQSPWKGPNTRFLLQLSPTVCQGIDPAFPSGYTHSRAVRWGVCSRQPHGTPVQTLCLFSGTVSDVLQFIGFDYNRKKKNTQEDPSRARQAAAD